MTEARVNLRLLNASPELDGNPADLSAGRSRQNQLESWLNTVAHDEKLSPLEAVLVTTLQEQLRCLSDLEHRAARSLELERALRSANNENRQLRQRLLVSERR
jgi:hypothetical protein